MQRAVSVVHVGCTYTTVGTVRPSALLGGLVDLDVLNNQGAGVKALGVSVGLGVLEQTEQKLGRLDGPSSLGDTELLACSQQSISNLSLCTIPSTSPMASFSPVLGARTSTSRVPSRTLGGAAGAASISSHGHGLDMLLHVLEEGHSTLQLPAVDGLGGLACVLERHSKVGTAGAGRFRGLDLSRGVSGLVQGEGNGQLNSSHAKQPTMRTRSQRPQRQQFSEPQPPSSNAIPFSIEQQFHAAGEHSPSRRLCLW